MHGEHRLYKVDMRCPQCGISMPKLPMCKLTGTCVECARKILTKEICNTCPNKNECDLEIRGIEIFKQFEQKLSIILPDLVEVLKEEVENILRILGKNADENNIELFVKTLISIINSLSLSKDFGKWLLSIFNVETVKWLLKTSLTIIKISDKCKCALVEYSNLLGVDYNVVENIVKMLVIRFVMFNCNAIEFIHKTFRKEIVMLFLGSLS